MKKTGQMLREAREARGISLQEVSVHLKISSRILKALEDGDQSQLPAKTFLRGFVQSYGQFLRLDGNEVLELFQAEMGTTHPKMITKQVEAAAEGNKSPSSLVNISAEKTGSADGKDKIQVSSPARAANEVTTASPPIPSLSVDQKTWSHSLRIGTGIIVVLIGIIIVGVIKTIEKYEREAQVVPPPPLDLQAVPRTEVVPTVSPLSSVMPSDQAAILTPTPEVGGGSPSPVAERTGEPQITPSVSPIATSTDKPGEVSNDDGIQSQEVIVEALDRVVVEYSIDDKPKATIALSPEKVHTFRGEKKISLGLSDGGSINLIYNGKDLGVPGSLGKPLKLSFPE